MLLANLLNSYKPKITKNSFAVLTVFKLIKSYKRVIKKNKSCTNVKILKEIKEVKDYNLKKVN